MNAAIHWFAHNRVAANLLMVMIMAGGLITVLFGINREVFPEIPTNMISVSVLYPGAAPEEVEEGICIRIEEAVQGLEGVKRITSTASENIGTVLVEALDGTDVRQLLDDVKSQIDAIDTFPEESEEPIITEAQVRSQVLNVAVFGDTDEASLRVLGERVRDDILALPGITQAQLVNVRPYEISIEVSEEALRRYGLTFDDVARAVRRSSLDLPGGTLKTSGGEILLRTKGQAYRGGEFESLILLSGNDGSQVRLGDVARVVDGFADTDQHSRFNGKPSVTIQVFRVGNQDALDIAGAVKGYVARASARVPEGISLTIWLDYSRVLEGRQNLLMKNGMMGGALVLLVLSLFLRLRLALWVSLGIPISFLGALWLLPTLDVTINLISLFAFIIVLGIVVDDAIVVGENINKKLEDGMSGVEASIAGAREMAVPVTFAVLTSVAAFAPLLNVVGRTGQVMRVIPLIVIPTLLFSLVESLWILPAHLSHLKPQTGGARFVLTRGWRRIQDGVAAGLHWLIHKTYRPSLRLGLEWRYLTVTIFAFFLLFTVGLVGKGAIKFVFFPNVEADYMIAGVTMPLGTPVEVTEQAVNQLRDAARELEEEYRGKGHDVVLHVLSSVGDQPLTADRRNSGPNASGGSFSGAHLGEVGVELVPSEERTISSPDLASRWREIAGSIPDATELTFSSSIFSAGDPINIQLAGQDTDELKQVAEELKTRLGEFAGVFDISDSDQGGKEELKLKLKPGAETTGLSLADLARQIRQAFYGEEAQRIQRGRDDVKVMVRFPEDQRRSVNDLESMRIRTPDGTQVPFTSLAEVEFGRGYASIERTDRRRTVSVTADVDLSRGNANEILRDVEANVLPELLAGHPGITYSLEGEQQQQRETMSSLLRGFAIALLAIFALMAIPFRSYFQPLVIMTSIPFGLIGAIWGHVLMGMNLTILSLFGIVALTGVVVNDSIVLVDQINRLRREGIQLQEAVREAGVLRFRAIVLTSLTTVAGLTPIMLERSVQAQFLIPIAVSLAFGVLFATFIILIMVPASYLIMEDFLALARRLGGRRNGLESPESLDRAG